MPTTDQILKVLKNERECIKRQIGITAPDGSIGICDRNCAKCDLCLPDDEILEVYDFLINGYELLQNEGAKSYSIRSKEPLSEDQKAYLLELWGTCAGKATVVMDDLEPFKMPDNMRIIGKGEQDNGNE